MGFTVNGEPTPKEAFQYDMEKNLFVDAFQSLSEITGKAWKDADNGITKEMWKEGLALTALTAFFPQTRTYSSYIKT